MVDKHGQNLSRFDKPLRGDQLPPHSQRLCRWQVHANEPVSADQRYEIWIRHRATKLFDVDFYTNLAHSQHAEAAFNVLNLEYGECCLQSRPSWHGLS